MYITILPAEPFGVLKKIPAWIEWDPCWTFLLWYSFGPRPTSRALATAGSFMASGLSINGCSHSKKSVWRGKTRLTTLEDKGLMWFRCSLFFSFSFKKTKRDSERRVVYDPLMITWTIKYLHLRQNISGSEHSKCIKLTTFSCSCKLYILLRFTPICFCSLYS